MLSAIKCDLSKVLRGAKQNLKKLASTDKLLKFVFISYDFCFGGGKVFN